MSGKTVEELKAIRAEIVERRRQEADLLGGADDGDHIERLVHLHHAIEALDAVIISSELDVEAMIG